MHRARYNYIGIHVDMTACNYNYCNYYIYSYMIAIAIVCNYYSELRMVNWSI